MQARSLLTLGLTKNTKFQLPPNPAVHGNKEIICRYMVESFKLYSSQIVLLYDINVNWDSCVNWNILYWRLFLKTIRYKQSWQGMNKENEWFWESRCLDSLQCCQHRSSTHLKPSTVVESVARRRPLQTGSPSRPPPSVYEWSTFHSPEIKLHRYAW